MHQIQPPITSISKASVKDPSKSSRSPTRERQTVTSWVCHLWKNERERIMEARNSHSNQYISSMSCLTCVICCAVRLSTVDPDTIQGCMSGLGRWCVWSEREGSAWVRKPVASSVVYLRQGGGTHTLLTHTGHEPHRGEWLHTYFQVKMIFRYLLPIGKSFSCYKHKLYLKINK